MKRPKIEYEMAQNVLFSFWVNLKKFMRSAGYHKVHMGKNKQKNQKSASKTLSGKNAHLPIKTMAIAV